jgi:hypothetical protein
MENAFFMSKNVSVRRIIFVLTEKGGTMRTFSTSSYTEELTESFQQIYGKYLILFSYA